MKSSKFFFFSLVINTVLLYLTLIFIEMGTRGLFDTTSNIIEFEQQRVNQLFLNGLLSICFIGLSYFVYRARPKFQLISSIIPGVLLGFVTIFDYISEIPTPQFNKINWETSKEGRFIEARSIVLTHSFNGKSKTDVLELLGKPNYSIKGDTLDYNVHNAQYWSLYIYFDTCCVQEVEMTKFVWDL